VARIYDDLGFDQLAKIEASRSLGLNPSNHSAHRFLSDTYAHLPRHEIARVSELLQSQLLQPININPVQPALPFVDLNPVSRIGPASSGASEYTSLFERDQLQFTASGAIGNMETLGGDVIASGLWEDFSFSAGVSHIETDGFRDNNDQENDVYNLFAQWTVSPRLNLQAELRNRDTEQGDLGLNFDPEDFFPEDRRKIDEDVARLGARIDTAPGSTVIVSGIHAKLKDQLVFVDEFAGSVFSTDDQFEDDGYQLEIQHILERKKYNLVAGIGVLHTDVSIVTVSSVDGSVYDISESNFEQDNQNIYLYGDLALSQAFQWTIGAGYADFSQGQIDVEEFVPKIGVEWNVTDNLRLRSAFFKTVKRPLVVGQTIEPTQVAGFNQLYDDSNGSKSDRFGVGIDMTHSEHLFSGFEISRREVDFLFGPVFEERQEDLIRGYLNWMISDTWVFTLDAAYEDYRNEDPFKFNVDTPTSLKSLTIPASIQYFATSGFFAELQTTYLQQDIERGEFASLNEGKEEVVLLDAAVGYRLPKRIGTISLNVLNAMDKSFFYQDDSFRSADVTRNSSYIPERRIVLLVTVVF